MTTINNINVAGHCYSVMVDDSEKIVQVACKTRWPMSPVEYIGLDSWTLEQLQAKVEALSVGAKVFEQPLNSPPIRTITSAY